MRSWTFKRKILAAQVLAQLLSKEGLPDSSEGGKGEGKGAEWSASEPRESDKSDAATEGDKGEGKGREGKKSSGAAYQEGDPEESAPAEPDSGNGEAEATDEWKQPISRELMNYVRLRTDARHPRTLRNSKWDKLTVVTLPFERKKNTRGSQAVPEGVMLRFPHRYATDMALFRRVHGHAWGSLLVDNSGSMSLPLEELHAFLRKVPAANIAVYSCRISCYGGIGGVMTIVAHKGLTASDSNILKIEALGGNGVDGPCLRWLAQQPKPRVWVSDGRVTGAGDGMTLNLLEETARICKANRILRVATLEKALKLVEAGRGGVQA